MSLHTRPTILIVALLLTTAGFSRYTGVSSPDVVDVQHVMDAFHDAVVSHDGVRLAALFIPDGSTWLTVLSDDAYARAKAKSPGVSKIRVGSYKDFATFVSGSNVSLDPRHSNVR